MQVRLPLKMKTYLFVLVKLPTMDESQNMITNLKGVIPD